MIRSNAVPKYSVSHGDSSEGYDLVNPSQKGFAKVLKWPTEHSGKQADVSGETRSTDEVLRGFRYSSQHAAAALARQDDALLLGDKPGSRRAALQAEMPAAIKAYEQALAVVRTCFPGLSVKKTFDFPLLEQTVATLVDSLERNRDALLCVLKTSAPNVYLFTHAVNVCVYAAAFALSCGKSYDEAVQTGVAGLIHDTGMALLPIALLQSSAELSLTEQVLVKRHPLLAWELLSSLPDVPTDVIAAALEHHERFDGSGYPAGLSGSKISFVGHLMAICSAFDAITGARRHRQPVNMHAALGEMFMQRNKQFHPIILENFIRMLGVYPVGSVVLLQDGYCGVVTGSPTKNPTHPVITLVKDPKGNAMPPLEFDMAKDRLANIGRCVSAAAYGVDVQGLLGIPRKASR